MGIWQQTVVLLRKNFQIKRRNKRETLQELIVPVYWILLLLVIKLGVKTKTEPAVKNSEIPSYDLFSESGRPNGKLPQTKPIVGVVTENEPRAADVIKLLRNYSSNMVDYKEFKSSDEMVQFYKKNGSRVPFGVGIVFEKDQQHGGIAYTLRVAADNIPDIKVKLVGEDKCHDMKKALNPYSCPANKYRLYKMATLQASIDAAISKIYHFSCGMSLMRIMGMQDTAYWLSWFLTYAIIILIASIIMNAIAVPAGLLGASSYFVMVIIFYLFGLSMIMFSFVMTPLFKNARTAGTVASLMTIVLGILIIPLNQSNIPNYAKWLMSLLSPTAFAFALSEAVDVSQGLQFSNLSTKGVFPASNAILMIILDIFLYLFLALYLDAVVPGEYGRREPPYFIFLSSYWKGVFGIGQEANGGVRRQLSAREVHSTDDVEPVGQEMIGREAISIHKMRKVFPGKEKTVAVDDFSMDIYEGQVTALLGHNGAGKTTLIATLTGMLTPTSGTALFYGKDITKFEEMMSIRKTIGVCPQQDVLFDYLTVLEHLQFYSGLKGVAIDETVAMVNSVVKDIGLEEKKDDIAKNLSGGQKRKLCVGIALIGNPKVLFLDEPTSGMDPYSRRSMWALLQRCAKDRVVLLTTHFMDEADVLADYKAIMSKGKLRCAGTSLFLKNRFGIGYHLNMALSEDCDTDRLRTFVQQHVSGASVIRHHGREIAYSLPLEEMASFSGLFASFEANSAGQDGCTATYLGVTSYGVSMTTLEEVFLQLEDTSNTESGNGSESSTSRDLAPEIQNRLTVGDGGQKIGSQASSLHSIGVELNATELNEGSTKPVSLLRQQVAGLLRIRWLASIRSPIKIFFMIIVPPILMVIGLVVFKTKKVNVPVDTLQLALSPSYCISPASSEAFAAPILFQNSTGTSMEKVLEYFNNYKVDVDQVKSLGGYLNQSITNSHCLGFDVKAFPQATNMSAKPNLASRFVMRYNDTTVHSIPVGVNLIGSIYNMYALATQNKSPYPIKTFIQPFPTLKPKWSYDVSSFTALLLIGMAFVFIPGGFAIDVVQQRQQRIRNLLRVSGVSSFTYWLQMFISDAIIFLIPAVLMFILILAFQIPSLIPGGALVCLFLAVILYVPVGILFSYCLSFMFNKWDTCQQVLPQFFSFGGFLPFLAVALVDMISSPDTAITLHYVFVALDPAYGIFGAIYYINRIYMFASIQAQSDDVTIPASQYFTWTHYNGIPAVFIAMSIHIILFGLLLLLLDSRNTGSIIASPCTAISKRKVGRSPSKRISSFTSEEPDDEDVKEEKEKLHRSDFEQSSAASNEYAVTVKGLWKKFGSGKKGKVVVKDLYFGVQPGEVFGLLGPNGAGKSTTLNMITAEIRPSRGHVTVAGYDLNTHAYEVFQHMGFCPQTDALWDDVTLEEHLIAYARVRGVPWGEVSSVVNHYMSALKITEHAKKRAKELSGGTKRKLSFEIAMLGDPELLLLDEPSTGMDPSSRRFLWNMISTNVQGSRGAILTTHSMEEADALCSRVGIMVRGQMKCLGSTQHLKSKYGSGYTLEIKLASTNHTSRTTDEEASRLAEFVEQLFPGATQTECFAGRITYKVPQENVARLSNTFAALEEGKQSIGIEEYSFSQSTLEQVFLEFARDQDDDRTGAKDKEREERLSKSPSNELPPV